MSVYKMARPLQTGLNYFPLDVDCDQDDKIALIEADFGSDGFTVVIKLLMKIYSEGYFYHWGEIEQKLLARRIPISLQVVCDVVDAALKWNLFNPYMFQKYGILTSSGIQKRYFEAVKRRKEVKVMEEYILIPTEELEKYSNLVISSLTPKVESESIKEEANTDTPTTELMYTLTPQSKVKESRVKESKVNHNEATKPEEIKPLADDSNTSKILTFYSNTIANPTKRVTHDLQNWISVFNADIILEAINRTQANGKGFGYLNAILKNFQSKGIQTLEDIEAYDRSFKEGKRSQTKPAQRKETLPNWASSKTTVKDEPADKELREDIRKRLEQVRSKR